MDAYSSGRGAGSARGFARRAAHGGVKPAPSRAAVGKVAGAVLGFVGVAEEVEEGAGNFNLEKRPPS